MKKFLVFIDNLADNKFCRPFFIPLFFLVAVALSAVIYLIPDKIFKK